jgi:hypothetical protein
MQGRVAWILFWTQQKIRQILKILKKSIIAQEIGRNQSGKLYEELFTLSQTVAQLVL